MKKNVPLIILSLIYIFSIAGSYFLKSPLEGSLFTGISGDLIISAFSGVVFFFIGMHFQRENDVKLNELHEELERELSIRNYDRMVSFLKSGRSYNFFLPEFTTSEGEWFSYAMRGKSDGDQALAFSTRNHQEFVIYVEDIAYRSVMNKGQLSEYVYGPLQVGNCYFISFNGSKMLIDRDYEGKSVEICWYGSDASAYMKPSANALYFPSIVEGTTLLDSFIYNRHGEEARSGWRCEIYQGNNNQIFIRLSHEGELKRVVVTYEDEDYLKESPFIKIERVEGYFSSVSSLNGFKNIIDQKVAAKGLSIPEVEFYDDNLKGQ